MYIQTKHANSVPVIGFENKSFNANWSREFVFQGDAGEKTPEVVKKARVYQHLSNTGKVLGAFPLVTGQIIGLARIISTIRSDNYLYNENKLNKAKHIVRGLSECFGLGALWLLLDVGSTATRFFSSLTKDGAAAA